MGVSPVLWNDRVDLTDPLVLSPFPSLTRVADHLSRGQTHEVQSDFPTAIACYDAAIAQLRALSSPDSFATDLETRRQLGIAWMNRGNALQKIPRPLHAECHVIRDTSLSASPAVAAYDQAIALFETLPFATEPVFRNHLGAAWLNRGHALIAAEDVPAALSSFDRAIAYLEQLPLGENPFYRLNLVGAWTNRAHLQLTNSPALARTSAQHALALLSEVENETPAFAEISLRARRALVTALGQLLVAAECHVLRDTFIPAFATETSDAIDEGLALARTWETRGITALRPLALRLFRLGAQLYRVHQPHFLAEFLLENLSESAPFAGIPEFLSTADEALRAALAELQRPRHLVIGSPESEQLLATFQSLRDARAQLSVSSSVTSVPPLVPSV